MRELINIVKELRIQDDLRCKAIAEIATEKDIPYVAAEKIMDTERKNAERITSRLLREVVTC